MNQKQVSIVLAIIVVILIAALTVNISLLRKTPKTGYERDLAGNQDGSSVDSFLKSKFRVIGVFTYDRARETNPQLVDQVALVVATDRSIDDNVTVPQNDSQCGSMYSQFTCYFFIEPLPVGNPPEPKFLGKLTREGAFIPKSVKFIAPDSVRFETVDGDAGGTIRQIWDMNLNTGKFTVVDKIEDLGTQF